LLDEVNENAENAVGLGVYAIMQIEALTQLQRMLCYLPVPE
jgi:hypothetical protein